MVSFPNIGYVQGMNYISATLLYHCDEATAFWLTHALLSQYNVGDIYEDGFEGMF